MRCDGEQPECGACRSKSIICGYPKDARRTAVRARRAHIQELQQQISDLRRQICEASDEATSAMATRIEEDTLAHHDAAHRDASGGSQSETALQSNVSLIPVGPFVLPEMSRGPTAEEQSAVLAASPAPGTYSPSLVRGSGKHHQTISPETSPTEGRLQIYGATSLLHDQFSESPLANLDGSSDKFSLSANMARDCLISNAAICRQEEFSFTFMPHIVANIDFDGVSMDMAMHLLDLHWNRQHLSYMLTYRPAIMDSLMNNGPYINKLLLNAIYLQSSLYSDRASVSASQDIHTNGMAFYHRFKSLLPQYIDHPSIPTAVALLTCGSCLVPHGHPSAGWALCNMAYGMIVDLGCHLDFAAPGEAATSLKAAAIHQEMRKRLYWGAYVGDKFQALFLGRPPAMDESAGNVTYGYLDSYEEKEEWRPYLDPQCQSLATDVPPYHGRPSYALSTFSSLLALCRIANNIINAFYSVNSANMPQHSLLRRKDEILNQLDDWKKSLPTWLQYEPTSDPIPPPHQITPQYDFSCHFQ